MKPSRTWRPPSTQRLQDLADDRCPPDADFLLVSRLITGDLTTVEADELQRRVRTERNLWPKIGPVIAAFTLTIPCDEQAARESFDPNTLMRFGWIDPDASDPAASGRQTRRRPAVIRVSSTDRAHWDAGPDVFVKWIAIAVAACFALIYGLANYVSPLVAHQTRFTLFTRPGAAADDYRQTLAHAGLWGPRGSGTLQQDVTGPGQTRTIFEPINTTVTIRPNSRFMYRADESVLEFITNKGQQWATISGEVQIVTTTPPLFLGTPYASIQLGRLGTYVVRWLPHGEAVQLTVSQGVAIIAPLGGSKDEILADAGDYVTIPRLGPVRIVHDSTGFPLVDSRRPVHIEYPNKVKP